MIDYFDPILTATKRKQIIQLFQNKMVPIFFQRAKLIFVTPYGAQILKKIGELIEL